MVKITEKTGNKMRIVSGNRSVEMTEEQLKSASKKWDEKWDEKPSKEDVQLGLRLDNNSYISKVKLITKKDEEAVEVNIGTFDTSVSSRATVFKSKNRPHPDLVNAMQMLCTSAKELLEIDPAWKVGNFSITAISYSWNEDYGVMGAKITAMVGLHSSDAPLMITTPHLPYAQCSDTAGGKIMPARIVPLLDKVQREAEMYIQGKSAPDNQMDLPL